MKYCSRWAIISHKIAFIFFMEKIGPIGYPEISVTINQNCVTSRKNEDCIYRAVEDLNHA